MHAERRIASQALFVVQMHPRKSKMPLPARPKNRRTVAANTPPHRRMFSVRKTWNGPVSGSVSP